ncbi:copper resistance CopC/CopD family protein [Vineibacter terrae]|uniref:copper resistance CopC/CopD family protein n=1 Tax=Vineibacter terrae TaxID=2586908 RepID=UPI002E34A1CC|nr:CopD family protein [Vineibacter terrae]HEX2889802.1 CopD family protein [Vineibacter terrae]
MIRGHLQPVAVVDTAPAAPSDSARRWLARAVACLGIMLAMALASMGPALAHASLVRTDPGDGEVTGTAPARFVLTFNESVTPLVLRVIRPDGTAFDLLRQARQGRAIDVEAPKDLGIGTHVLSWRVVSEDGHPVSGAVVFSIGAPSVNTMRTAGDVGDGPVRFAIWATKLGLFIGMFVGIGGAFYRAWISRPERHGLRVIAGAIILGFVAALFSIGLQGLDALGLPFSGRIHRMAWAAGVDSSQGRTAIVVAAALIAAFISLGTPRVSACRALSLVALLAIGAALTMSGHASTAHPQWLTRSAVFLHSVGIAFWTGALTPLFAQLIADSPDAAMSLRRFSRAIPFVLVPLVAAGIVLAVVQVQHASALWTTDYGRVLLIKLGLLAAVAGLAAYNRWRLTPQVEHATRGAARRLARVIAVEMVLVLAVLSVVALWRFTPPPRALAAAASEPAYVHIHGPKAMADLTITPGRAGPVEAVITIAAGDFGPLKAKEVTLILTDPVAGIGPLRRPARRSDDGSWRVEGLVMPIAGHWSVRIVILISDFEQVTLEDTIGIRP